MNQAFKVHNTLFRLCIILLFFFSTTYLFCYNTTEAISNTIDFNVNVLDSIDSSPLISATVTLKQNNITGALLYTNSVGQVRIPNLNPGEYSLSVSFKEYSEYNANINIDSNFNQI